MECACAIRGAAIAPLVSSMRTRGMFVVSQAEKALGPSARGTLWRSSAKPGARETPWPPESAAEVMGALVRETKAECIIPLGGAIIPYIVSPTDLEREVGVPVLNTKAIGIRFAEMCVQFGMSHSARTYPRAKLQDADFSTPAYAEVRVP